MTRRAAVAEHRLLFLFIAGLGLALRPALCQPEVAMDLIEPSVFAASLANVPLSAEFNGEVLARSGEGAAPGKQTVHYRVYRDSQKRISVFLQNSPKETVPLLLIDPPNDCFAFFDNVSQKAYRILVAGMIRDKSLFPVTGGIPTRQGGKRHFSSEVLGPAKVKGIECVRTRAATTWDDQPTVRDVTERCFSEALGLLVEYTSSGPKGDAHVTLDHIQHGEPPPEVFSVPANYHIIDTPLPTDGAPPQPH